MNHHPRWLIDDEKVVVFEKHIERNVFGLVLNLFERRQRDLNQIVPADQLAWSRNCAIQPNESRANQSLQTRS